MGVAGTSSRELNTLRSVCDGVCKGMLRLKQQNFSRTVELDEKRKKNAEQANELSMRRVNGLNNKINPSRGKDDTPANTQQSHSEGFPTPTSPFSSPT